MPKIDEVLSKNQKNYDLKAWESYSLVELAQWISLLAKRSTHRNNKEKALKDIEDSRNYLSFLEEKLMQKFS